MALEALLQQLTAASHLSIRDPRIARQQEQCVACGVCPSELRDMREREQKTHNIHAGQQRLVEMYGKDCQTLTSKLAAANDSLERQQQEIERQQKEIERQQREIEGFRKELADKDARLSAFESRQAKFDADVRSLKQVMSELERARSLLEDHHAVGSKRPRPLQP
jgi:chromosome segregation ATPase